MCVQMLPHGAIVAEHFGAACRPGDKNGQADQKDRVTLPLCGHAIVRVSSSSEALRGFILRTEKIRSGSGKVTDISECLN
jgi:hypothetical protein